MRLLIITIAVTTVVLIVVVTQRSLFGVQLFVHDDCVLSALRIIEVQKAFVLSSSCDTIQRNQLRFILP